MSPHKRADPLGWPFGALTAEELKAALAEKTKRDGLRRLSEAKGRLQEKYLGAVKKTPGPDAPY